MPAGKGVPKSTAQQETITIGVSRDRGHFSGVGGEKVTVAVQRDARGKFSTVGASAEQPKSEVEQGVIPEASIISDAGARDRKLLQHGTQFYVIDGNPVSREEGTWEKLKAGGKVTVVHSHSSTPYEDPEGRLPPELTQVNTSDEYLDPFSGGDIAIMMRYRFKHGVNGEQLVITEGGAAERLRFDPGATSEQLTQRAKDFKRGYVKQCDWVDGMDPETRAGVEERGGAINNDERRRRLRELSKRWGMVYEERLRWR